MRAQRIPRLEKGPFRDLRTRSRRPDVSRKAACALANKLAPIAYACLRDHAPYGEPVRTAKKIDRQSFATPALA